LGRELTTRAACYEMSHMTSDLDFLARGSVEGSSERGNESSGSIRGGEFLYQLSDYQLLRRTAPWSKLRFSIPQADT